MKKEVIIIFVLIVLIFVISYIGISSIKEISGIWVTGKASSQETNVSINVIAPLPSLVLINPKGNTYITNESLLLNYSVSGEQAVWYSIDSNPNVTITSSIEFNVFQGNHSLYLYANNTDNNITSRNVSFFANSSKLIIEHGEFAGANKGSSTDFNSSSYEELQNLSDIILENTDYGKILFNEVINVTDDENPNDTEIGIHYINISSNRIELNTTALPNFNKSSTLWFYGLTLITPRILKDGSVCPSSICTQESYSSGILKFNVTGFSVYSAEETPSGETPTGGGGGGGGGTGSVIKDFSINKDTIKIKLKQGGIKEERIIIRNTGDKTLSFNISSSEKIKDFIKIDEESFTLEPKEEKILEIDFIGKEDSLPELYIGEITVTSGNIKKEILTAIEIISKESLFDVKLEIPEEYLEVLPRDALLFKLEIFNFGGTGKIDVEIEYIIKDKNGNVLVSEKETSAVETTASFVKEINIPANAAQGEYVLYAKVNYNDKIASGSAWFNIVYEKSTKKDYEHYIIYVLILIIITSLLIIAYEVKKLRKMHKKINQDALIKRGLIKSKRR